MRPSLAEVYAVSLIALDKAALTGMGPAGRKERTMMYERKYLGTRRTRLAMAVFALLLALVLSSVVVTLATPLPAQAQAQNTTSNERIPLTTDETQDNPCTGEPLVLKGTVHFVFHGTEDAAGGVHFKGHSNLQGQAVSASGIKYIVNSVGNNGFSVRAGSLESFTFTAPTHLNFIRQGSDMPEDDFTLHALIHITQNAKGRSRRGLSSRRVSANKVWSGALRC
jgi:hypothetical protein